jgi:hypothetical protein
VDEGWSEVISYFDDDSEYYSRILKNYRIQVMIVYKRGLELQPDSTQLQSP